MKRLYALGATVLLTGCGTAGSSNSVAAHRSQPARPARVVSARVIDAHGAHPYAYAPALLTVPSGTTVTWTNKSRDYHTVTEVNGKWTSKGLGRGHSYSHRFTKPGKYVYVCAFHGYMVGTVVVRAH